MNAPANHLAASAAMYERAKAELVANHGLAEDDPAFLDTLDGITDLGDLIAALVRRSRELDAHVDSLKAQVKALSDRKAEKEARSKKLRSLALHYMETVGMPRLERPDFTASPRWTKPGLAGLAQLDAAQLPDRLRRTKYEPDATAIRDALEAGEIIEGVSIGNAGRTLTVR